MNILGQHLIDGQCVAYPHVNNEKKPEILRAVRLKCLLQFLRQPDIAGFDILNLQEVGPLDIILVEETMTALNETSSDWSYSAIVAKKAGGGAGLKVVTIYNKKTL